MNHHQVFSYVARVGTPIALGSLGYPLTVGLALVSAPLTLAAHGLLAL